MSDGKQHFLLRYASSSDDEKTFIAFEEISADRAARYRVANFFRRYFSGNPLVVVVLFVSCKEDAVSFCNDAKIYDNIAVGETPKKQNRGARIRCCFYDYGARDGFFMPDLDGKPHYFA